MVPIQPIRWFVGCDQDGGDYLVPAVHRSKWEEWCDLDPDTEESWATPNYAIPIDGFSQIEFTNPTLDGRPVAGTEGGAA